MNQKKLKDALRAKIIANVKDQSTLLEIFDYINALQKGKKPESEINEDTNDENDTILAIKKNVKIKLEGIENNLHLQKIINKLTDKDNYNKILAKTSSLTRSFVNNFGALGLIINFFKTLFAGKDTISESLISSKEKQYSKYSYLFESAGKKYKSFNRHYRELMQNDCSDQQILQHYFKLIENNVDVYDKKEKHFLFLEAEKALLGDNRKITNQEIGIELAERVKKNFNNLLDTLKVLKDLNYESNVEDQEYIDKKTSQINLLEEIIKKLVKNIKDKELLLEECKIKESKLEIYNELLSHKRKLFSFILRTDAWSNGQALSNNKIFNVEYIEKQFKKLPLFSACNPAVAPYATEFPDMESLKLTEETKNKGILKLFGKKPTVEEIDFSKLLVDDNINKAIEKSTDEQVQQILLNLQEVFSLYKRICFMESKLTQEISRLNTIFTEEVRRRELGLSIISRISLLEGNKKEMQEYKKDILSRSRFLLCKAFYVKDKCDFINNDGIINLDKKTDFEEKIKFFVKEIYPNIIEEDLNAICLCDDDNSKRYIQSLELDKNDKLLENLRSLKSNANEFKKEVQTTLDYITKNVSTVKETPNLTSNQTTDAATAATTMRRDLPAFNMN